MEILLQILQMPCSASENPLSSDVQNEGVFWGDIIIISRALDRCYRYGILEQPSPEDVMVYRQHAMEALAAMGLMNVWHAFSALRASLPNSILEIRSMPLSELVHCTYDLEWDEYVDSQPQSDVVSFHCSEFSVELL